MAVQTSKLGMYEVKGVWFCTARRYLETEHGGDAMATLGNALDPEVRRILHEALPSDWHPETALQSMLAGLHATLARGNDARFVEIITEISLMGVNRFFRLLLQLGTPAFTMRKVPVMWRQLRRGPGTVSVTQEPGKSELHYQRFPFNADPIYVLLTQGTCRAVVFATCGRYPVVNVLGHGDDWLKISVVHG